MSALAAGAAAVVVLVVAGGLDAAKPPPWSPAPVHPDIVEDIPSHLQIQNSQQQEWLRFTTVHVNIGAGNLQIRGGGQIAPCTHRRDLLRPVHGRPAPG